MRSAAASLPTGGNDHSFYSTWNGSTGWWLHMNGSSTLNWGNVGSGFQTGTKTIYDDAWHHVALARASGTARTFVDGALDSSASMAGNGDNTAGLKIGELQTAGGYLKG